MVVKGYLFFDWNFIHISNNKLKIQVEPNLDEWLNTKSKVQEAFTFYNPKGIAKELSVWLQNCHKSLDREFRLSDRINVVAVDANTKAQMLYDAKSSYFKVMSYACDKKTLNIGNKLKIKTKQPAASSTTSSSSSNVTSIAGVILAEILDFEVKYHMPPDQNIYFGTCNIRYRRLPTEVFGTKIC